MTSIYGKLRCLERPLFRRPPTRQVVKVTRSLFGPVDHVETRRLLERDTTRMSSEKRHRWSFDFELGRPSRPTAGDRYLWEPITGSYNTTLTSEPRREPIRTEPPNEVTKVDVNALTTVDITSCPSTEPTVAEVALPAVKHKERPLSTRKTTIPG